MTDKLYPHGKKGFASMDPARQRQIARQGGIAAHVQGRAHEWTVDEAREAGRKGGSATGATKAKAKATPTPKTPLPTP